MSETILSALITFGAGAVGAITGLIGGIYAAKLNADSLVKQTVVQEVFKKRTEAFENVFLAHLELVRYPGDIDRFKNLLAAIQTASVVSSPKTAISLNEFWEAVESRDQEKIQTAKAHMLLAVQGDLTVFTEPALEKNIWKNPSFFTKMKHRISKIFTCIIKPFTRDRHRD